MKHNGPFLWVLRITYRPIQSSHLKLLFAIMYCCWFGLMFQFCRVVLRYEKKNDGQLSLEVNDIIHVLRQYESGWAAGVNASDMKGFFPSSCIVPILPVTVKRQPSMATLHQNMDSQRNFRRDTRESRSLHHSGRYDHCCWCNL